MEPSDFQDNEVNVQVDNQALLESIVLDGVSILIVPQDMNWIPPALSAVMYTIMVLEIIFSVTLGTWMTIESWFETLHQLLCYNIDGSHRNPIRSKR